MVKVKNKRNSGLADKVHNKRKADIKNKRLNPFEVHINKEKIKVLGKKSKHDRGLPGVSRAKAIQKRKETLGTEMKLMNKTNTFIDRRIGEKNNQLSAEDRMIARFAAERAKQHGKKNIYNLADDEILTHRGQTLEQIEKFDDPKSSDDEDEEGRKFGGLDDEFVSEGHFGGGILSKTEQDGAKSHKDLIEQLIAESKKRKAEKQKEKEQTLDLTEKLDSEWKDLQPVVFKRPRMEEKNEESIIDKLLSKTEKKSADYDKMMRELKFDRRGTPSDGLKNDEKQAKEEREKLEKLEKERQMRMYGDHEIDAPKVQQTAAKHRSADDLDDNFELEDEKEFMLAYDKDGKPLVPDDILKTYSVPNAKPKFEDGISDTSEEDDDDDEDGDSEGDDNDEIAQDDEKEVESNEQSDDQSDDESQIKTCNENVKVNREVDAVENKQKGKDANTKDLERNNKQKDKDVKSSAGKGSLKISKSDELSNNDENEGSNDDKEINNEESSGEESDDEESSSEDGDKNDDFRDLKVSDEESGDELTEDVEDKITLFFDVKGDEGENLKDLLSDKTPTQQSTTLQKLIQSYDPGLSENNKEKQSRLFAHMLQYINDIFTDLQNEGDVIKAFLIFDKLAPHFYSLTQTNKVSSKKFIVELLKEKHDKFKKNPRKVPDLDTLIFFKLVSLLYPTSDFRHPVTTPSLVFMSEILTLSKFNNAYSVSRGLFIVALVLEYTALSKRFVPSAINFLRGILYLAANTSILNPVQVVPPFRLHKDAKILNLADDCSEMEVGDKMAARDLVLKTIDNGFKITSLLSCAMMLKEFFNNFNDLEAQECIIKPHLHLFSWIDLELYPKKVASKITETVKFIKEGLEMKTYTPLSREKKKLKILRLYEPDFQEFFTDSKSSKLTREQAERARLENKVKKEMKGALREIRRDKAYIASVKIRQKIQSDNIRKAKVKQIYKDAAIQQGELNKLKRMK